MKKFTNRDKSAYNSQSGFYRNNLFGINEFNETNEEVSNELFLDKKNMRDKKETEAKRKKLNESKHSSKENPNSYVNNPVNSDSNQ